jgi:hypothetical protein
VNAAVSEGDVHAANWVTGAGVHPAGPR